MKFLKYAAVLTVLLILAIAPSACDGRISVQVDDLGLVTGPTAFGRYTTLATIVTAVGATQTTVIVNRTITANTQVLPANLRLDFQGDGFLEVANGQTVTVESPAHIIADRRQDIFGGAAVTPIAWTIGGLVYPHWWGAVGNGVADDYVPIQMAIDSIEAVGDGTIWFPTGEYLLGTVVTVVNGGTSSIHLRGDGPWASMLRSLTNGLPAAGSLVTLDCTGNTCSIKDMGIVATIGGNFNIYGLELDGNGILASNLWINGFDIGLYVDDSNNILLSDIVSELNHDNYESYITYNSTYVNLQSYRALFSGIRFTGQEAEAGSQVVGSVTLTNFSSTEDGHGGDGTGAGIYVNTNIHVVLNGPIIDNWDNDWPRYGIRIVSGAEKVSINNPSITHVERYGIWNAADTGTSQVVITGGNIDRTGWMDQTVPWFTSAIYKSGNQGSLTVIGTQISRSAGHGIFSQAPFTQVIGVSFQDCLTGGSDGGGVNATTGADVLYLDPQTVDAQYEIMGNHFNGPADPVGKNAVYIDNDATPLRGNIKFLGNNVADGVFATTFTTALLNADLLTYDFTNNHNLLATERSGNSTIVNPATAVVVAHGLDVTPLAEHITITGAENPTVDVGTIWVDTIGAANFTVNVEVAPGASDWDFGWKASIK